VKNGGQPNWTAEPYLYLLASFLKIEEIDRTDLTWLGSSPVGSFDLLSST
jgi:hypothetical protein